MAWLVAVTFARSRFAAFSVGVVGAWHVGMGGGPRRSSECASRANGRSPCERRCASSRPHPGSSASALRQRAPHRGRCGEAGWRYRWASNPIWRAHAEQGVEKLHRIAFRRQRHVRAEVREIQARRAHVYAPCTSGCPSRATCTARPCEWRWRRADRSWAATASLWTFRGGLRTATWRCPPWCCKSCRRRPPARRPRPSRVL